MYLSDLPETRYARSGDLDIAYQEVGDGPLNLVVVMGLWSHLDFWHEVPGYTDFLRRLGTFARVVYFDKRGYGLSDRWPRTPTLEERMDDIGAVMDAAGMERAAVLAWSEGAPLAVMFAAAKPERVSHLLLFEGFPRMPEAPEYPFGPSMGQLDKIVQSMVAEWGSPARLMAEIPELREDPERAALYAKGERMVMRRSEVEAAWRWMVEIDVRALLPGLALPVLVMHRKSGGYTGYARYMHEHIPGSELATFAGSMHSPWGNGDEEEIATRIEEFLTGRQRDPAPVDRFLATVLFTDIVSSTERVQEAGDRAWKATLDRHDGIVNTAVSSYRGQVLKGTGDGVLATFDGPGRAVLCARELADRLGQLGIAIRAGIHTGEVERRGDDIVGLAVHLANRVASCGGPGEVLVSRTVVDLTVGSDFSFESRGERELKGFDRPWELFALARR